MSILIIKILVTLLAIAVIIGVGIGIFAIINAMTWYNCPFCGKREKYKGRSYWDIKCIHCGKQ